MIHDELEGVAALGEGGAKDGDGLPLFPAAGVGDDDWGGDFEAGFGFDVEGAARFWGGDAEVEGVMAGGGDVDGVVEPFAGFHEAKDIAVAGVGVALEINGSSVAVGGMAAISVIAIVEGDAFAAGVEFFEGDSAGEGRGSVGVGVSARLDGMDGNFGSSVGRRGKRMGSGDGGKGAQVGDGGGEE